MPFIPHTEDEVREMLAAIGVDSIDDLFDEIPAELRASGLELVPPGINEMEIGRLMHERAEQDKHTLCFAGAGAYEHHIPAAVWEITTRGEFYSAYTPYQAEASQGTLQLLYEYQTMMTSLTGMDISNASLYDGASALAEAYGVPYAQVTPKLCDPKTVEILPREFLESHIVLPLFKVHDQLTVAVSEPTNVFLIDEDTGNVGIFGQISGVTVTGDWKDTDTTDEGTIDGNSVDCPSGTGDGGGGGGGCFISTMIQ